jgi:hypothetical protein
MSSGHRANRAQSGLDRLALFLFALFFLLLVTPTVLGFAGIDVRESGEADDEAPTLTVLGIEGVAVDGERESVGAVRVTVTNAGGGAIDPRDMTATLVQNGTYDLVSADGESADGTFTVETDDGDDDPVLREHTDRAVLVVDLGTDDVAEAQEVGERLRAGDSATLTFVTGDGASVRLVLSPPEPLPETGSVAL